MTFDNNNQSFPCLFKGLTLSTCGLVQSEHLNLFRSATVERRDFNLYQFIFGRIAQFWDLLGITQNRFLKAA